MSAMKLSQGRHDADAATMEDLSQTGFSGPRYEAFIAQMHRYAWPVLLDRIRTGRIAEIHTPIPHPNISTDEQRVLHDSSAEREDLALATIARAEPQFKKNLRAGRWNPRAGRSLKSYFIGACAQAFWPEFRLWRARRRRHRLAIARLSGHHSAHAHDEFADDPELQHSRQEAVKLLREKAGKRSPELNTILEGLQNGLTFAEVGEHLGCTDRAVEGRLYQFRKTAWGLVRDGRIDPTLVPGSRARLARELARR